MDDLDDEILHLLDKGNVRYTSISKKLGIPTSTAHARIKKMEKSGIIRRYRGDIDWKKAGLPLSCYILINIDVDVLKRLHTTQEKMLRQLLAIPYVKEGNIITGDADLLIKVIAKDTTNLGDILLNHIDRIEGIAKTKAMIVLE